MSNNDASKDAINPPKRKRFPADLNSTIASSNGLSNNKLALPAVPQRLWGNSATSPAALPSLKPSGLGIDSAVVREKMVRRVALQHNIIHPSVLAAMQTVPRHLFVDKGLANRAYEDMALSIGYDQTISTPSVVAIMTQLLFEKIPAENARILEIGTGCGYQTAILAATLSKAGKIMSVERIEGLHKKATQMLHELNLEKNVTLFLGDGMEGIQKFSPYHGILASACAQALPSTWLNQLALGGRIVFPLSHPDGYQSLWVVDKTEKGFIQKEIERVRFVPLKSGLVRS